MIEPIDVEAQIISVEGVVVNKGWCYEHKCCGMSDYCILRVCCNILAACLIITPPLGYIMVCIYTFGMHTTDQVHDNLLIAFIVMTTIIILFGGGCYVIIYDDNDGILFIL